MALIDSLDEFAQQPAPAKTATELLGSTNTEEYPCRSLTPPRTAVPPRGSRREPYFPAFAATLTRQSSGCGARPLRALYSAAATESWASGNFFDGAAKSMYKKNIKAILNRKNTINGKLYKNDPTIMAW